MFLIYVQKTKNFSQFLILTLKKEHWGNEGFLSDFFLIAYIMDSSQPIGALIAVTRKGHAFGKNAFIKILIIDKPYQRQGLSTLNYFMSFLKRRSTFCLGNLKSGWETRVLAIGNRASISSFFAIFLPPKNEVSYYPAPTKSYSGLNKSYNSTRNRKKWISDYASYSRRLQCYG